MDDEKQRRLSSSHHLVDGEVHPKDALTERPHRTAEGDLEFALRKIRGQANKNETALDHGYRPNERGNRVKGKFFKNEREFLDSRAEKADKQRVAAEAQAADDDTMRALRLRARVNPSLTRAESDFVNRADNLRRQVEYHEQALATKRDGLSRRFGNESGAEASAAEQQLLAQSENFVRQHKPLVEAARHEARKLVARKNLDSRRAELESLVPALAEPENRERLVRFLVRQGVSATAARNQMDPSSVAAAWKVMRLHEDVEREQHIRDEVAKIPQPDRNPLRRQFFESDQAERAHLRRSGTLDDHAHRFARRKLEKKLRSGR